MKGDAIQPVTFYIPSSAGEPIEIDVEHSGLRMVLVNRESLGRLGSEWRVIGLYFLLGPSKDDPDRFLGYVGEVGRRDLLTRLAEHARQKEWWNRALLIRSATAAGFNSAEIGWLEGRLYDVLNNAVAADLMNKSRPGDDSIPSNRRGVLEKYVEPVIAALRACGASPDTADQRPAPKGRKKRHFTQTVKDLLDASLLKAGTRLHPTRRNLTETALVLSDGSLQVGREVHGTPSSAAVAVSGSLSEAGWSFWGAPSGDGDFVPLSRLRDLLIERPQDPATEHGPPTEEPTPSVPSSFAVPQPHRRAPRRQHSVSLQQLLAAGLLQPGEYLRTTRRGSDATALLTSEGRLRIGATTYGSLSTAAKASSGNSSEPGWAF